jgi:glycosyltransferase involved in cell wall biosynthesis
MPKWQSKLNFKFLSHVDGGIVLGNSLKYIFRGMIPDDKIFVCPNCVDDSYIAKSISDKITSTEFSTKLNILYLSNFIPSKGYRKVLELAELFEKNGKEDKFGFHFAGKFFDEKEREYFFNKKAYLKNVVYHGVVSGDSKTKLLEECNIFILLTNYPNEGQPISILEAMGNGMAIITTDHAGIPEIADSTNGLVCKKNDIDLQKVYDYLVECYDNRKKLSSVCVRNYEITKQKYTEGRYIDNMDKIFETVCREK